MILLHAVKMTLTIEKGKQVHYNEDVTFYTDKTALVGVNGLAELQRLKQQLHKEGEPIEKYHLLHMTEIHTPWFSECSADLQALNAIELEWQLLEHRSALETETSWYAKCQT